jgi:hypothetical protein
VEPNFLSLRRPTLPEKSFSFTPASARWQDVCIVEKPFNGFVSEPGETVETVSVEAPLFGTGLKPGVNEKDF